ncbi:MAG: hypothetical protein HN742_36395 [Lentisphaerae bacterium]|jgi:hypothetical protein|nr:hypothetical protein [Lentisphaerota bacterium]MBT4820684.1 hypothetical protein [Lentisphaerota bacterium]MBT5610620.1 hypothetical protein [Lentisphaerota bacterium]MBT7053867.1 hypothetical protein [Lentisphaerota bacterium]MBT7847405.1 hypothetical protein [Lentisphaerota bacterium]
MAWSALSLLLMASAVRGDIVVRKDSSRLEGVRVVALRDDAVVTEEGQNLALPDVLRVDFTSFPIPPKPTRLILTDGAVLCGLLRRLQGNTICFRSSSFGQLELPTEHVAGVVFGDGDPASLRRGDAPNEGCSLRMRDGNVTAGQLMWADASTIGLLTDGALVTLPASDVLSLVLRAIPPLAQGIVLRNGDRLAAFALAAEPEDLMVRLAGTLRAVPLKATQRLLGAARIPPAVSPAASAESSDLQKQNDQ